MLAGLVAAPHHRFEVGGTSYFFATDSLRVVRGDALTCEIMRRAAGASSNGKTFDGSTEPNFDAGAVAAHITELRASGFLIALGESPEKLDVEPGSTVTFMVNVSQRCNLTCSYCYVHEGRFDYAEKPIKRMKQETFKSLVPRVFEMFPDRRNYAFHFYGGEPLMNFPAIRVMCEAAFENAREHGAGLTFYITTNGTLIDETIADFFDRFRFNVYFSIDGDKESHDQYRKYRNGRGSFDDVMRNFALLRSRKHVHLIGSSVVRDGFSLGEAIRFLEQHGADTCKAERVRLEDGAAGVLTGANHDLYLRDTRELIQHYVDAIASGRTPMDYRLTPKILQLLTRKGRNFFCAAGERMFGVAANGEIYPCALHVGRDQARLGSLAEGIDEKRATDFRRRYSAETQPKCGECWARNLCGGGCSAMVDRFGHEDCEALRAQSESAIVVFAHFAERDPMRLLALIDPEIVTWMDGPEQ
jgi:uncharacterized protein